MDDQDMLIQRFLDQDLTPEERVQFLETVDAEPGLRRRWLNFEMVVAEAGRLPRVAPSRRFTDQVMARLNASPKGLFARMREWIIAPRTLEWNFAGALAVACVAVVAVAGLLRLLPERVVEVAVPAVEQTVKTTSANGGTEKAVYVRLVLLQPEARSVSVAGDFNGWNPLDTTMERAGGGMWTTTIQLKPGRYQYMFVIDGKKWIADPLAGEAAGDGFGSLNAVLDVTSL